MLILFLAIGSASAFDDDSNSTVIDSPDANSDEINTLNNSNDFQIEKSDEHISQTPSDETQDVISSGNSSNSENQGNYSGIYESTHVECSPITQQYTTGNVIYQVKVYDIVNYDGVKYKEPKYYSTVKIKVFTGSSYKEYSGTINTDGISSIKVPNLALGTHKLLVYDGNTQIGESSISVIRSATTVYAPVKTIKHKKNTYYKIKVVDSHKNPVKNVVLKVKVYTGKKYKTYSIKTSSKGIAKLYTKKFSLGTHKIIIKSNNKNYKISKTSKIVIKKKVSKKAEKTYVTAPTKTAQYKKTDYLQITVKNSYADPVKKLVIKVKVYTGKKSKTYSIKTNTNGVAKLNTNKFSIGTHKVSITTKNSNYKVSKSSKIIVKKTVPTSTKIVPTSLKSVQYYPYHDEDYFAKLTWYSKNGATYQILKKTTGGYDVIAAVKADSDTGIFYDNVSDGKICTYTVRELIHNANGNLVGPYDKGGLRLIDSPNVDVDFQNLKAKITWEKIPDATKYRIFRKMGLDGEYKLIAIVDAKKTSYTDYYYKSIDELSSIMSSKTFIDSSFNSLVYTVRACNIQTVNDIEKISYGLYLKDGDFNLESPTIVYLKDNKITWGKVPNAQGYMILKKTDADEDWQVIAQTGSFTSTVKTISIGEIDNNAYYSVKAFSEKNGETVYSNFDKGFNLKNYNAVNTNRILFIGDSISFGSPYYSSSSIHIFSYPHRIAQLTGCVIYNPSIPGSTYHDLGQKNGKNIENTNYYRYRICREVVDPIAVGDLPGNWETLDTAKNSEGVENTHISDYNIVVLAAGTNDYLDNAVLGSDDSADVYTFNGAFNHIMDQILTASNERVKNGLDPIKVVFVDLFYSDRTYVFKEINNRDVTPNQIGLTLMDYQRELDNQYVKWSQRGLELYNFETRSYDIVNSENCPYTACDNLHFSKFTYSQYGNAMAQFLVDNVFA